MTTNIEIGVKYTPTTMGVDRQVEVVAHTDCIADVDKLVASVKKLEKELKDG